MTTFKHQPMHYNLPSYHFSPSLAIPSKKQMVRASIILLLFLTIYPISVLAYGKPKSSWNNLYIIFIYIGFFTLAILLSMLIRKYRSSSLATNPDQSPTQTTARGLDTEDIESLPSLRFSEIKMHKVAEQGQLECSVCLMEFNDQQILRLLPDCLHVFHPDCIAPWLTSHVTCPVCRTSVDHRRGSNVSTSSILERVSGSYSERFEGVSVGDIYDQNDQVEIVVESNSDSKLHDLKVELDGTRGRRTLVRCYSTGELAMRFPRDNSRSTNDSWDISAGETSRHSSEIIENSTKSVQLRNVCSSKSDRFVDYSSLLFGNAKSRM